MYPTISDAPLTEIWSKCEKENPNEAVGLLLGDVWPNDYTKVIFYQVHHLVNEAADPTKTFTISEQSVDDLPPAEGQIVCFWHSHPTGPVSLSPEDQTVMWQAKMPMLVVSLEMNRATMYTYAAPRAFDGKRPIIEWGTWRKPV